MIIYYFHILSLLILRIAFREQIAFIETKDIFYLDAVQSSLPLSAEVKNPEYEAMQSKLTMYKVVILC